jgi:hypothetical protein
LQPARAAQGAHHADCTLWGFLQTHKTAMFGNVLTPWGLLLRLTEFILPPPHPSVKEMYPRGGIYQCERIVPPGGQFLRSYWTTICTVTRTYSRVQHGDREHRPIEFTDNGLRRRIHQLCPTRRCSWYKLYLHVFGPVVLCTIIIELSLHFLLRTPRFQNFDPGGSQVWSCNWDRLQLGQFKKIQTKFDS